MLRVAGEDWQALIPNNECVTFRAIFDTENRLEDDRTGMPVLIAGSVITCLSSVASEFVRGMKLKSPTDVTWYVREVLKMDDGVLSRVTIVTDETECRP
jgi:hypothetical protein